MGFRSERNIATVSLHINPPGKPILLRQGRDAVLSTMATLASTFVVAVLLNYLWELAQAPLYVGLERYNPAVFWHCLIASLGDGLIVLLIVVVGRISLRRWDWFEHPGVPGYLVMFITGLTLAVLVEFVAVHILGRWQYTPNMPTVPGLGIGLRPDCANAYSSAADVSDSDRFQIREI
jgi:hypothetical protein